MGKGILRTGTGICKKNRAPLIYGEKYELKLFNIGIVKVDTPHGDCYFQDADESQPGYLYDYFCNVSWVDVVKESVEEFNARISNHLDSVKKSEDDEEKKIEVGRVLESLRDIRTPEKAWSLFKKGKLYPVIALNESEDVFFLKNENGDFDYFKLSTYHHYFKFTRLRDLTKKSPEKKSDGRREDFERMEEAGIEYLRKNSSKRLERLEEEIDKIEEEILLKELETRFRNKKEKFDAEIRQLDEKVRDEKRMQIEKEMEESSAPPESKARGTEKRRVAFDIEKALAGAEVWSDIDEHTTDKCKYIHLVPEEVEKEYRIICLFENGLLQSYLIDGRFNKEDEKPSLFILEDVGNENPKQLDASVSRVRKLTITSTDYTEGSNRIELTGSGFHPYEILGLLELARFEYLQRFKQVGQIT